MSIHQRQIGTLTVSSLGLGCMGMSEFYGTPDEQGGTDTIHRALDLGVTFDFAGEERPFPLDIVPRVIPAGEWDVLERGVGLGFREI